MKIEGFQHKKILVIIGAVLLLAMTIPAQSYASTIPESIKVGLCYGSTAVTSCTISSEAGFILGAISDEGFTESLPLPAYTSLVATVENGHVALRDLTGVLISSDIGINGCLMPADYNENGLITFENSAYRGGLMLIANSSQKLTVINFLTMDEYLYGVLHKEMSQSCPLEALKAQAVAARSFAADNLGRHSSDGFDVCTTTNCQVYGGYGAEYPSTCQAVDETSGLLVWSQGEPASVYYHKNSGGHTQSSADVWSSFSAHLIGIGDPYSPNYAWTTTIYFDSLQQKLFRAGYDLGTVTSVKVGGRNSAGAVSKLVIVGSEETVTLEKELIRSVLGTSLIRSRHFNIGDAYTDGGGTVIQAIDIKISSGSRTVDAGKNIYVLSAGGSAKALNSADLYMFNGSKTTKAKSTVTAASGYDDSIVATDGKVTLSGMGSGHGVGMSQDGAIEMAKQGFSFEEILHFYFTDIEVR